jgi:hypothetical protein
MKISRYSEDILDEAARTGWRSRSGTRSLKLGVPLWICVLRIQLFVSSADVGFLAVVKEDGYRKRRKSCLWSTVVGFFRRFGKFTVSPFSFRPPGLLAHLLRA